MKPDTRPDTDQLIADFVERMGLIIQADGLPRIAGRIMGLMVVHGGPFSFAELAERLQVSRASVSTNTRLLENLGVIERTTVPRDRQDYFRLRPNPYARMLRGYADRMRRTREVVQGLLAALPPDLSSRRQRLGELDAFYDVMIGGFEAVIKTWDGQPRASTAREPRRPAKQPAKQSAKQSA